MGAGLSGVEIASEMSYYAKQFFKRGSFQCDNFKISLISSRDTVLPGFDPKLEGTLIALGGSDLYGIVKVKGFTGYLIKQYVFLRYKLPLLRYIKKGYSKLTHSS
ncbi:MAG: hypothetical protein U9Q33_03590 [Campylobacterota bacterium]|nr:hypothetical protein [Campylobacterota bacterium]